MATPSSVLAWRIPGTGEPGGLPSMGSHRVGHDWSDLAISTLSVCPTVPFLPPLMVYTTLFSTSWSLFLPLKWASLYHFSRVHIYVLICNVCFSFWLTSLCMTDSRSTHITMTQFHSFLWLSNIPSECLDSCCWNWESLLSLHPSWHTAQSLPSISRKWLPGALLLRLPVSIGLLGLTS